MEKWRIKTGRQLEIMSINDIIITMLESKNTNG